MLKKNKTEIAYFLKYGRVHNVQTLMEEMDEKYALHYGYDLMVYSHIETIPK